MQTIRPSIVAVPVTTPSAGRSLSLLFASAAGLYAGTYDGACAGSVTVLLCPDGTLGIYMVDSGSQQSNGQIAVVPPGGNLDFYLVNGGAHVLGMVNPSDNTIAATIHGTFPCITSYFTLTRTESQF